MDYCMLYQHKVIFIIYAENGIFASQSDAATDQAITEIGVKVESSDQGTLYGCISVNIEPFPQQNNQAFATSHD